MSDVDGKFEAIVKAYRASQGGPVASARERRKLYGLYRQATDGDIDEAPPGFFAFDDQLKYRAWKGLRGTSKEVAKQRYVELARQLGYRDPGDSPVPWISTETWRREESWTNPDQSERYRCIHTPELALVEAEHCERPLTVAHSEQLSIPPTGSPEEQLQRLEDPPKTYAFQLHSPRWPVCCRRLAVLVGYRGVDAAFSDIVAEACLIPRDEGRWFDGVLGGEADSGEFPVYGEEQLRNEHLLFHCHDCGTVYVSGQTTGLG